MIIMMMEKIIKKKKKMIKIKAQSLFKVIEIGVIIQLIGIILLLLFLSKDFS